MDEMRFLGADVSWVQKDLNVATIPGTFVIPNASRANTGALVVGSRYAAQVDQARRAGREIGHYFFNGNLDPVACAEFFIANLHDFRKGDVLALDVEGEPSTHTRAWSPAQVLAFATRVRQLTGVVIGVYLNKSEMDNANWTQVVQFGCWLWLAYPSDTLPRIRYWPHATMWQYTSALGFDQNKALSTLAEIGGSVAPSIKEFDMPALIRNSDGSIGFVSDQGMLDAISDINEVNALQATGLVSSWVQMPNPQVWRLLSNRTARLRAAASGLSPAALASQTAAIVVPAVVAALAAKTSLTPAQIEETSRAAIDTLLSSAPIEDPAEQRREMSG